MRDAERQGFSHFSAEGKAIMAKYISKRSKESSLEDIITPTTNTYAYQTDFFGISPSMVAAPGALPKHIQEDLNLMGSSGLPEQPPTKKKKTKVLSAPEPSVLPPPKEWSQTFNALQEAIEDVSKNHSIFVDRQHSLTRQEFASLREASQKALNLMDSISQDVANLGPSASSKPSQSSSQETKKVTFSKSITTPLTQVSLQSKSPTFTKERSIMELVTGNSTSSPGTVKVSGTSTGTTTSLSKKNL
jgi:hypothetical protein